MHPTSHNFIKLGSRHVEYRQIASRSARKLRLRVGVGGVEVVKPPSRSDKDVVSFLERNESWIINELERVERLRKIRVMVQHPNEILFRGSRTTVRFEKTSARLRGNVVGLVDGEIVVKIGPGSRTPVGRSLENWLRRQARTEIQKYLNGLTIKLRQKPRRIYVMEQRTKWGN